MTLPRAGRESLLYGPTLVVKRTQITVKGYKRTRKKLTFSKLVAEDLLVDLPVRTSPPKLLEPPVLPVPAEAPPLFSLPAPPFTAPPSPASPPVLPSALFSPVRPRACVRLVMTL